MTIFFACGFVLMTLWALYLAYECDNHCSRANVLSWKLAEAERDLEHYQGEYKFAVTCSNKNARGLDAQREANAQLAAEKDYIIDILRALVDGEEVFLDE